MELNTFGSIVCKDILIDQLGGEFYWRHQFTSRNREYVTGWENRFQVIMICHPAQLKHSLGISQVTVVNNLFRHTECVWVIVCKCTSFRKLFIIISYQARCVLQYAVETWIKAFRFFIFFASSTTENTAPTLMAIAWIWFKIVFKIFHLFDSSLFREITL